MMSRFLPNKKTDNVPEIFNRDGQSERIWGDSWAIMTPIIKQ